MDKNFLKKMLRDQVEPMDVAVHNKLLYLESAHVFSGGLDTHAEEVSKEEPPVALREDFSEWVPEESYEMPEVISEPEVRATEMENDKKDEGVQVKSRHQSIYDKIAALRGISVSQEYMRRK